MSIKKQQASEHHDGSDWDIKSVLRFRELATASKPDGHSDHVANKEWGDLPTKEDGNG
ncbi:MAG: hypothetical protein WC724_02355 [Candidatus Paceibacterota bacterium]|jgi:hypothetical protein